MRLPPAESLQFTATATLITGRVLLRGVFVRETSGAAIARISVRDGGAGGVLLCPVTLNPTQSARDWFTDTGILVERDVTVIVDVGAVSGAVLVTPESRFDGESFPSAWFTGDV